jgi:hypothetical protein
VLSVLCEGYPLKCKKLGTSGFFSNNRVISVEDQKFKYYYCPSGFKDGNIPKESDEKASINLADIYEVAFLPEKSITRDSIMLSMPLPKIVFRKE